MKNILYSAIVFLLTSLFSCQKQSYVPKFESSPQERIGAQVELVRTTLISAENGWIGTLSTGLGGGFGFYMTFNDKEYVQMYADLTNTSAATMKESRYRVKADMGADLVFDTYTYISLLNDATPSVFGGSGRDGFRSDIEFIYERSNGDSIIFIGKRYRQIFSLVKATAGQKAKYVNGDYLTAINGFKSFFAANPNAYFEINANTKVAVEPNLGSTLAAGKRLALTAVYGDSIASATAKYAFTVDKMDVLESGVPFGGTSFGRLAWKDASALAIYDATGKEYVLQNNPTPLLPLYKLWGSKYTGMLSNFKTIYPGTSSSGETLLNTFHNRLASRPPLSFAFNFGRLNFVWDIVNRRLRVDAFHSQNGGSSGWITTGNFNYTTDANGEYTFTGFSGWSGGYVSAILPPLQEFLLNNKVKFDYHIDNTVVYAKMSSTTNPDLVLTFSLTN